MKGTSVSVIIRFKIFHWFRREAPGPQVWIRLICHYLHVQNRRTHRGELDEPRAVGRLESRSTPALRLPSDSDLPYQKVYEWCMYEIVKASMKIHEIQNNHDQTVLRPVRWESWLQPAFMLRQNELLHLSKTWSTSRPLLCPLIIRILRLMMLADKT